MYYIKGAWLHLISNLWELSRGWVVHHKLIHSSFFFLPYSLGCSPSAPESSERSVSSSSSPDEMASAQSNHGYWQPSVTGMLTYCVEMFKQLCLMYLDMRWCTHTHTYTNMSAWIQSHLSSSPEHYVSMAASWAQTNSVQLRHSSFIYPDMSLTHLWHLLWSRPCLCPRWCRYTGLNPLAWHHESAAPLALSACGCWRPESCHLWSRWWSPLPAEGSSASAPRLGALSTPWA